MEKKINTITAAERTFFEDVLVVVERVAQFLELAQGTVTRGKAKRILMLGEQNL